jgi:hypothetical protein
MEVSGQFRARYPLDGMLRTIQSWSGHGSEEKEKYIFCPCRKTNPSPPPPSLVTILTELHRLMRTEELHNLYSSYNVMKVMKSR